MIRVLIVDDSALMRRVLSGIFAAQPDFTVEIARDGQEAIAQLPTFQPDVVTLDVHMPGMDGLACLDRIMLERPCPVLMVSALTEAGAAATLEAMALGAVDFLPKPSGPVSLAVDELAPLLLAKVRAAAQARLSRTARLTERVRLRSGRLHRAEPRSATLPEPPAQRLPAGEGLVLIGTSTGGPPALEAVLTALPADFPWPIVIAQHMPASFTGPLARRLDRICALGVAEVGPPVPLLPGHAYIGRGDADILITRRAGALTAMAAPEHPEHRWHPSADRLVQSAMAQVAPQQLVAVLMTGMGDDGAVALARLHEAGGTTIAEAEETAVVWGMPGALVRRGGAGRVLPLPRIAGALQALVPAG